MRICWHGTNKEAAMAILEEGFNPDSWFALHLEDALEFGGPWVFEVMFDDPPDGWEQFEWQFHRLEAIPESQIISLTNYNPEVIVNYAHRREQVFNSNA